MADTDPATELGAQNRFSALRALEVLACNATKKNCASPASFSVVYTSPANAFQTRLPCP